MPSSDPRSTRSRTLLTVALVTLAVGAGGCFGGGSSSPSAHASSGSSELGGAQPVTSTVVLGHVAGNIPAHNKKVFREHRKQVLTEVGRAVDTWIDGGFVGVTYPRSDFGSAFQAFTPPAARDAKRQMRLMTNWELRQKIDGVAVDRRKVTVDVLAPRGHPAGATARVALVFTTTGDTKQRVAVHGRLFLTPDDRGSWQIFGYDVSKGGAS